MLDKRNLAGVDEREGEGRKEERRRGKVEYQEEKSSIEEWKEERTREEPGRKPNASNDEEVGEEEGSC